MERTSVFIGNDDDGDDPQDKTRRDDKKNKSSLSISTTKSDLTVKTRAYSTRYLTSRRHDMKEFRLFYPTMPLIPLTNFAYVKKKNACSSEMGIRVTTYELLT